MSQTDTQTDVLVMGSRRTNAEAIRDCFTLGYLRPEWHVLDATYGLGRFWTLQCPDHLVTNDLHTQATWRRDFTDLLCQNRAFNAVVFDPPYKLNGTSTGKGAAASDKGYGVHTASTWQDRHDLIFRGITECARVADRMLLIKCQDQVVSGKKRWQTRLFADAAETEGFTLVDQLHVGGYRAQPPGRRQVHARQDYSTLLILERT
jgi:hypothetical protein